MGKYTKMYNDWLDTLDLTLGPKELKFGLQAFEAGCKAMSKLNESWDIHEPGPENKKIALVTTANDDEVLKLIIGYDTTIDNMFDNIEEMANSVLGGTFGSNHGGFKVTNVTEMTPAEFKDIVGPHMASRAWQVMEQRDYFYTIVSKNNKASALAKFVQMEDEADMDDEYQDFL